ncbi:hypothetical protein, conserved [Leishmania tarentolae]|uniref:Uncharacterized protein n=1 Tax=Leishmania tarentolae TaxID=5689 RepID=A0A640L0S1_LEITA|nr:hypothetical protein, conserved [Leishmania tarentolae]
MLVTCHLSTPFVGLSFGRACRHLRSPHPPTPTFSPSTWAQRPSNHKRALSQWHVLHFCTQEDRALIVLSCIHIITTAPAPSMLAIQWYTAALILGDVYELLQLRQVDSQGVAHGTWWFGSTANAPLAVTLYAGLLVLLMLSRLFVLLEPLNRWLLMLNTIHEGIRLVFYSLLFTEHIAATQLNTILLTFMLWNTLLYGRQYYTTMCMLREHSK